jgi:hypothetical protein
MRCKKTIRILIFLRIVSGMSEGQVGRREEQPDGRTDRETGESTGFQLADSNLPIFFLSPIKSKSVASQVEAVS